MTATMDIEVPRNGDYYMGWQLVDPDDQPIDLTGATLALQIRYAAGAGGAPVASATFDTREDLAGRFNVKISGSSFTSVDGPMEIVRLAYDFRVTGADGIKIVETRGTLILAPGVTV